MNELSGLEELLMLADSPALLTDAELEQEIQALEAAVEAPARLTRLRQHKARRDDEARARAEELRVLLGRLREQLSRYDQQYAEDLSELEITPRHSAWAVCDRAYRSGLAAYSLAHDLYGATGDRSFHRPWAVTDQIALRGGEGYVHAIRGSAAPKIETPWAADVARLRELMPRVERIGNGG